MWLINKTIWTIMKWIIQVRIINNTEWNNITSENIINWSINPNKLTNSTHGNTLVCDINGVFEYDKIDAINIKDDSITYNKLTQNLRDLIESTQIDWITTNPINVDKLIIIDSLGHAYYSKIIDINIDINANIWFWKLESFNNSNKLIIWGIDYKLTESSTSIDDIVLKSNTVPFTNEIDIIITDPILNNNPTTKFYVDNACRGLSMLNSILCTDLYIDG